MSFCQDIIQLYEKNDFNLHTAKKYHIFSQKMYGDVGFRERVGVLECCKLLCKNFHYHLKGQYHNYKDVKVETIQVEAWCDWERFTQYW